MSFKLGARGRRGASILISDCQVEEPLAEPKLEVRARVGAAGLLTDASSI